MRAAWASVVAVVTASCSAVAQVASNPAADPHIRIEPTDQWLDVPSPVGREDHLLDIVETKLSEASGEALSFEHDAFGSLIVRAAAKDAAPPVRLLLAVGVDEACYVISEIRDDGLLRLRTLARTADSAFHLAHEGRPVDVLIRDGKRHGVILVNSLHLRAPRPDVFGEENLWLDVGADSPSDVAAMGIELLDPVVQHEGVTLAGGRIAEPNAGSRAALRSLVDALGRARAGGGLPPDVAVAFVAQSQVNVGTGAQLGTSPLGRGGEAVIRRLKPATTIVLRGGASLADAVSGPSDIKGTDTAWQVLELRVAHAGSPVELVEPADIAALDSRLQTLIGGSEAPKWGPSMGFAADGGFPQPFTTLKLLVQPRGVSGHESPVRDEIRTLLSLVNPAWQPAQDSAGNLVLTLGDGPRTYAFIAHMDEIGLEVAKIRDDGLLETKRLGGMMDHLFRDTVIELVTHDGKVLPGIALPKPKDTAKGEDPAILLDVGARSAAEAAALGVAIGDAATVPKELNALGAHRVAGRSNDDRVGDTALLLALQELGPDADAKLRAAHRRVVFAWTTREETGLDGADALARTLRPVPDVVFAVDTFVTSDSPIEDPRFAFAKLGGGPVLRALDNTSLTPRSTLDRVREVARHAAGGPITLQTGVMGGGNDGSRFVPEGSIDCALAWPQRCSHSRVETLDLRDLEQLGHLIAAVALDF